MLYDEVGAVANNFPVIFFKLKTDKEVIQAKVDDVNIPSQFLDSFDFVVPRDLPKDLMMSVERHGDLVQSFSSRESRIVG